MGDTPGKINMEPENEPLEEDFGFHDSCPGCTILSMSWTCWTYKASHQEFSDVQLCEVLMKEVVTKMPLL